MKYTTRVGDLETTYEADTTAEIVDLINAVKTTAITGETLNNTQEGVPQ